MSPVSVTAEDKLSEIIKHQTLDAGRAEPGKHLPPASSLKAPPQQRAVMKH